MVVPPALFSARLLWWCRPIFSALVFYGGAARSFQRSSSMVVPPALFSSRSHLACAQISARVLWRRSYRVPWLAQLHLACAQRWSSEAAFALLFMIEALLIMIEQVGDRKSMRSIR